LLEDILYAIIALHIARRPINEQNIRTLLQMNHVEVDAEALEVLLRFLELLKKRATEVKSDVRSVDPRIVEFLRSQVLCKINQIEQFQNLSRLIPKEKADENRSIANQEKPSDYRDYPKVEHESHDESLPKSVTDHSYCSGNQVALYLYGFTKTKEHVSPDYRGIDGEQVFVVRCRDLCALVHTCQPKAYESSDESTVGSWIMAHQEVVDRAREDFGDVIPMRFNTIMKADTSDSSEETVCSWVDNNYDELHRILARIANSDEYGILIEYEAESIAQKIEEESELIQQLKKEIDGKPKGMAYFYIEKLNQAIKSEIDSLLEDKARSFLSVIKENCIELINEKTSLDRKGILFKVSCLVRRDAVNQLGIELDGISAENGFSVTFTGPWPPYSFVKIKGNSEKNNESES